MALRGRLGVGSEGIEMKADGGSEILQGFCGRLTLADHHTVDRLRIGQPAILSLLQHNGKTLAGGCDRNGAGSH
jgi:hypothetical protein